MFAVCAAVIVHHFVSLGKNVTLLPPLENFQIRQTMCDTLIVTFSNMVTNDQVIVNPLHLLDLLCGNIEGLGLYVV